MKKLLWFNIVFVLCVCIPFQTMADTYRLVLMDTTGSMLSGNRWENAKEKAREIVSFMPGYHDSLWQLRGNETREVIGFAENTVDGDGNILVNAAQAVLNKIEDPDFAPLHHNTPLADAICQAMSALENVGEAGDKKKLYVLTDGGENSSGYYFNEVCSTGIYESENRNEFTFNIDATSEFSEQVVTNDDRALNAYGDPWCPRDTLIPNWTNPETNVSMTGRLYQPAGQATYYDWAAGVQLGSWEWRMYYRVSRGERGVPTEIIPAQNREWPKDPSETPTDVIINVTSFFYDDEINNVALSGKRSMVGGYEEAPPELKETKRSAFFPSIGNLFSQTEIENSLFKGLAKLTGGKYIPVADGAPVPIIGDVDSDGIVGDADMRIVRKWYGRSTNDNNPVSIAADIESDGIINNSDIKIISNNWTVSHPAAPVLGDTNNDWCVDETDYDLIMKWYNKPPCPYNNEFYYADLNADGVVDDVDVTLYEANEYDGCDNEYTTCTDDIQNGDETDVDCGGGCSGCVIGKACADDSDCFSGNCDAYVCRGVKEGGLSAAVTILRWTTAGYCATIDITNNNVAAMTSWNVGLDLNGGTVISRWKSEFSGTSGDVEVTSPNNYGVIESGETTNFSGFCATLNDGGVAIVTDVSGIFE